MGVVGDESKGMRCEIYEIWGAEMWEMRDGDGTKGYTHTETTLRPCLFLLSLLYAASTMSFTMLKALYAYLE